MYIGDTISRESAVNGKRSLLVDADHTYKTLPELADGESSAELLGTHVTCFTGARLGNVSRGGSCYGTYLMARAKNELTPWSVTKAKILPQPANFTSPPTQSSTATVDRHEWAVENSPVIQYLWS